MVRAPGLEGNVRKSRAVIFGKLITAILVNY